MQVTASHTSLRPAVLLTGIHAVKIISVAVYASVNEQLALHGGHVEKVSSQVSPADTLFLTQSTDPRDFCKEKDPKLHAV